MLGFPFGERYGYGGRSRRAGAKLHGNAMHELFDPSNGKSNKYLLEVAYGCRNTFLVPINHIQSLFQNVESSIAVLKMTKIQGMHGVNP